MKCQTTHFTCNSRATTTLYQVNGSKQVCDNCYFFAFLPKPAFTKQELNWFKGSRKN